MIKKYKISVPKSTLNNIYKKVRNYPWNNIQKMDGWLHGTNHDYLKKISKYWTSKFNWKLQEKKINKFNNFTTNIEGIKIHFIREKGSGKNPTPLLILHGWPGSIVEFLEVIEKLAHPEKFGGNIEDSFDVIVPSLPGFGFSGAPKKPMGPRKISKIMNELMTKKLKYKKYIAQGGDWGATISKWIAELYPENCIGLHLNLVPAFPPSNGNVTDDLSEEEIKGLENFEKYQKTGLGYYQIQMTKPQSLGYALNDSPVGLAGWIVEKFHSWTNDDLDRIVINDDEVLAIVSLYWFTQSITSSMRLYYENGIISFSPNYIETPTGGIIFDKEIVRPPKAWAKKIYNIVHWTNAEGGHFAAMENPETLANDIVSFTKEII